jgi:hypothetical protein
MRPFSLSAVTWGAWVSALVASSALARPLPPAQIVSAPQTPFAACQTSGDEAVPQGNVEPFISARGTHAVVVWQQDRRLAGGARGLVAASSTDSGHTWRDSVLPFGSCATGNPAYERVSDPWAAISTDGRMYVSALLLSYTFRTPESVLVTAGGVAVTVSSDGGETWSSPRVVTTDTSVDKPTITADPRSPRSAYLVWESGQISAVSVTRDGGATWTQPRAFPAHLPRNSSANGNRIVVDPQTGRLYDVFAITHQSGSIDIVESTSEDRARTWSPPMTIRRGVRSPAPLPSMLPIRIGLGFPEAAFAPQSGTLYAVWEGRGFGSRREETVELAMSRDGVRHWSAPVAISPATTWSTVSQVDVASNGCVGVSYYALARRSANPADIRASYWLAEVDSSGRRVTARIRLTKWFPLNEVLRVSAGDREAYFFGDYMGLASLGTTMLAAFVTPNTALGGGAMNVSVARAAAACGRPQVRHGSSIGRPHLTLGSTTFSSARKGTTNDP